MMSFAEHWLWVSMHDERFRAQMRQEAVNRHGRMMERMRARGERVTEADVRCHARMIEEYFDQGGWWWDWQMRQHR